MADKVPSDTSIVGAILSHSNTAFRALEDVIIACQRYLSEAKVISESDIDAARCVMSWQMDLRQAQEHVMQFRTQFGHFFGA